MASTRRRLRGLALCALLTLCTRDATGQQAADASEISLEELSRVRKSTEIPRSATLKLAWQF